MLIYSKQITARLEYIAGFIGNEISGSALRITSDLSEYRAADGCINYSEERIREDEIWIRPHELLFRNDITPPAVACFDFENGKAFFKTGGDFPFDLFAASFYLLSRYEEYQPHQKDAWGRFAHEQSLAYRNGFLKLPLVNIWMEVFKKFLQEKFPSLPLAKKQFGFLPTYDIDEAFAYRHKDNFRKLGGLLKTFTTSGVDALKKRLAVLKGKAIDPYDAYEWMDRMHSLHGISPRYFFLLASSLSRYDRNIAPDHTAMQNLIRQHAAKYDLGIHPSWRSGDEPERLQQEISTLEKIINRPVMSSRQHFIRFNLPSTYRQLIEAGITEDFSMGYGSTNGFRASVASPFPWFDLEKNESTALTLYPFCFMDANSFFEQKQNATQALEEMKTYFETVKSVNGCFISIWHNTFLGTHPLFRGWRETYESFLKYAVQ